MPWRSVAAAGTSVGCFGVEGRSIGGVGVPPPPPLLSSKDANGHLIKREYGSWVGWIFPLLAKFRFLRGSFLASQREMQWFFQSLRALVPQGWSRLIQGWSKEQQQAVLSTLCTMLLQDSDEAAADAVSARVRQYLASQNSPNPNRRKVPDAMNLLALLMIATEPSISSDCTIPLCQLRLVTAA